MQVKYGGNACSFSIHTWNEAVAVCFSVRLVDHGQALELFY